MRKILVIGDSLTEQGYSNLWVAKLQDAYRRKADVVCRGLSGYNTHWALQYLCDAQESYKIVPPEVRPSTVTSSTAMQPHQDERSPLLFVTVFFGANDAVAEGFPQHVPLAAYGDNLKSLVRTVLEVAKPQYGVVVMTPPPVDEEHYLRFVQRERDATVTTPNRTFANTKLYRSAALDAVAELRTENMLSVCAVDLYAAFLGVSSSEVDAMTFSESKELPSRWRQMFTDGLHFDVCGGDVVFAALMGALADAVAPRDMPQQLAMELPHWSTLAPRR